MFPINAPGAEMLQGDAGDVDGEGFTGTKRQGSGSEIKETAKARGEEGKDGRESAERILLN